MASKDRFYLKLSFQVMMVFLVIIFASFIPDYYHDFFGDWHCVGRQYIKDIGYTGCKYGNDLMHDPEWHWGYRHWIWSLMGSSLFIIQIVRIVNFINKNPRP